MKIAVPKGVAPAVRKIYEIDAYPTAILHRTDQVYGACFEDVEVSDCCSGGESLGAKVVSSNAKPEQC